MKKVRKKLSIFLALTLMILSCGSPAVTIWAAQDNGAPWKEQTTEPPEIENGKTGDEPEKKDGPKESGIPSASPAEAGKEDKPEKKGSPKESGTSTASSADAGKEEIPAPISLLPLQEKEAYAILNGYTEDQLYSITVEEILQSLRDERGEKIQIAEDAKVVWSYYYNEETGELEQDVYHVIDRSETVDLTDFWYGINEGYKLDLIIGKGVQLDAAGTLYHITVYTDNIEEKIGYRVYTESGELLSGKMMTTGSTLQDVLDVPVIYTSFVPSTHGEDGTYRIAMDSYIASDYASERKDGYPEIDVNVYTMKEFKEHYREGQSDSLTGASPITEQILNVENGANAYSGTFHAPNLNGNPQEAENIFCIVYSESSTGKILGYTGVVFIVRTQEQEIKGRVYSYENSQMQDVVSLDQSRYMGSEEGSWYLNVKSDESNGLDVRYGFGRLIYAVKSGYNPSYSKGNYYFAMEDTGNIRSVKRTDTREDITSEIMPEDKSSLPYGIHLNLSREMPQHFEVTFQDGTVIDYMRPRLISAETSGTPYEKAPLVGEKDRWFWVEGAAGYENKAFVVENSGERTLDTIYGYGYQTIFLLDENAEMQTLKPIFGKSDNARVYSGDEQISGESVKDFSNPPVFYDVIVDDNPKNYQVTFVKKAKGPKLFVNGPDKREVFLTQHFENRHDILIANVGSEELTGLTVELLDAVNVKLDDYWTVGGAYNDTLAPFTTVEAESMDNLAKIRLLPAGEGEISGRLKISADGQEDVYIELTGYASNPDIITEELSSGVKYVPYSYMIATDNMYEWVDVGFELDGELPEGLEFYEKTGEIYGTPRETGEFDITVRAYFSDTEFADVEKELHLTIKENTNDNAFYASDEGYEIEEFIGTEAGAGTHDYVLESYSDQLFVSSGKYEEFIDLWLNGERLVRDVDYTAESGSTRMTIRSQTFRNKAKATGTNTIAAEFRVNGDRTKTMKRTAQNFRISSEVSGGGHSGGGSSSGGSSGGGSGKTAVKGNPPLVFNGDFSLYSDTYWVEDTVGWWYRLPDGTWPANMWCYLPYKGVVEWYYFNADGYMVTGWFTDADGKRYYLNPLSDGLKGRMLTGWQQIDGNWYYFKEESDGTRGSLQTDTWIGEYYVNRNGIWRE